MGRGVTDRAIELGAWQADAEMTLRAHLEVCEDAPQALPVIPLERIVDFQRQWHARPQLRALIRAAGRLDEAVASRSRLVRALWELAHSDAWRADGRGLLVDFPEFAVLFGGGGA